MSDWDRFVNHFDAAQTRNRLRWLHSYIASVRIYQHHVAWEPRWWAWVACVPGLPNWAFVRVPRLMGWKPADDAPPTGARRGG